MDLINQSFQNFKGGLDESSPYEYIKPYINKSVDLMNQTPTKKEKLAVVGISLNKLLAFLRIFRRQGRVPEAVVKIGEKEVT